MGSTGSLARVSNLIGEPTRSAMLIALMDGRALTAGELARAAGVTPSTASGHLRQLESGSLLQLRKQGRHRYYALASEQVAKTIEELLALGGTLPQASNPIRTGPRDRALRHARLCYNHLAGEVGVGLADRMVDLGLLELQVDGGKLTDRGLSWFADHGIELRAAAGSSGPGFCRACLDWSERRSHIAGHVGNCLLDFMLTSGWLRRGSRNRTLIVTAKGVFQLDRQFGLKAQTLI